MRITQFQCTNMELTPAISEYVEEKVAALSKLCESFDPGDTLRIEVGKSSRHHAKGPYFFAEMQLHVPGHDMRSREEAEDLYAAIDLTRDQMKRQLKEYKDKLVDAHRGVRPDKE